jgi:hypothetical protein
MIDNLKPIAYVIFIGIMVFFGHLLLIKLFPLNLYSPRILEAHPFLLIVTLVSMVSLQIVYKKGHLKMIGYAFLTTSLFKMLLSVLYLIPIFKIDSLYRNVYVVQFFIIYFIYLTIEVVYLVRQLKKN